MVCEAKRLRLKILAPISRVYEVKLLVDEGADEFYCGVLPKEWREKFFGLSLNRRPGLNANLKDFNELKDCVETAHSYGKPIYLTINQLYYTDTQYPLILKYIDEAVRVGVDGLIVGSLEVLLALNRMNIDVYTILSTTAPALNSQTVKFYVGLGVKRVILPRHLTLDEVEEIVKENPRVDFEVFILNSKCPNLEGFCSFLHETSDTDFPYKNACMLKYNVLPLSAEKVDSFLLENQKIWEKIHMDSLPCGVCALPRLSKLVSGVKIVGRGNPTWKKVTDLIYVKSLLKYLEEEKPSEEDFRRMAKRLSIMYRRMLMDTHMHRPRVVEALAHSFNGRDKCEEYVCYYPSVGRDVD